MYVPNSLDDSQLSGKAFTENQYNSKAGGSNRVLSQEGHQLFPDSNNSFKDFGGSLDLSQQGHQFFPDMSRSKNSQSAFDVVSYSSHGIPDHTAFKKKPMTVGGSGFGRPGEQPVLRNMTGSGTGPVDPEPMTCETEKELRLTIELKATRRELEK